MHYAVRADVLRRGREGERDSRHRSHAGFRAESGSEVGSRQPACADNPGPTAGGRVRDDGAA